ncbi:MAG: transposase [Porphyromonadaceae bacterium]|nr:transposase [Porphyromonadaceae bacterium]
MEELIDKLDKAFEELSSMNSRLIHYMEENHGLQDIVSSLREENSAQKKLLESMDQQLRLANEAKLHKDKRFGRKSETAKSLKLKKAKDREEDNSDFDGNPRTSYGKKTIVADKVVVHYCSQEAIPAGAHVLEERVHFVYKYKLEDMKLVYYLYEEGSRVRKVIGNFLSGFKGAIKTDGYNAYKIFEGETEENITRTGCMAHVRRKFLEALVRPFIEKISRLYWVEAEARIDKLQAPQVQKLRKEKSVPILGDLYSQIESLYHDKLTRYSDLLRKAINYAYHEWKAVVRYIENGNWSIDNNEGERRMKPVVMGRKNYKNYGSHQGASNGAYMYTLVDSCKISGGSPVAYLKDVLCSLIKGETDYLKLIPCNWVNNK